MLCMTLPFWPAAWGSGSVAALQEELREGQQSSLHHIVHNIGWVSLIPSLSPPTSTQNCSLHIFTYPPIQPSEQHQPHQLLVPWVDIRQGFPIPALSTLHQPITVTATWFCELFSCGANPTEQHHQLLTMGA